MIAAACMLFANSVVPNVSTNCQNYVHIRCVYHFPKSENLPEVQYPKPLRADRPVHDDLEHVVEEALGIVLVDVGIHEVVAEVVPNDGARKNVLEDGVDNVAFDVANESGIDDARFENVWEDGSSSAVGRIVGEIVSTAVEGMFEVVSEPKL